MEIKIVVRNIESDNIAMIVKLIEIILRRFCCNFIYSKE